MALSEVAVGSLGPEGRPRGAADPGPGVRALRLEVLEPFLALMPDAAWVVDKDGRIECTNEQAASLFGYQPGELAGRPVDALLPERFRGRHRDALSVCAAAPQARPMGTGLELWGRRRDGTEFPVDISLAPLAGPDGQLVVAAIRDATPRLAATAALAQLAAIVASSTDGMLSIGVDGRITTWNPGAERLFGYPSSEAMGRRMSDLVPEHASADLDNLLAAALSGRPCAPRDTQWLRSDGSPLDVAVCLSPIRDGDGAPAGFSAIVRDITERRGAPTDLARAQVADEQLSVMNDRHRIARDLHDLVIQRLFAAGMGLQSVQHLITDVRAAERVGQAVAELDLTIRDIRSTIFALNPPVGAVSGLRSEVIRLVGEAAGGLGFEAGLRFEGPVDASVPSDVLPHVVAVVAEGLSNAARHARASFVELELSVGEEVVLVIVDDGVGLRDTNRRSGLANLSQRAEDLGGSLKITSPPEGGTRIEWRVPVAR